jgi:hypothetical protein
LGLIINLESKSKNKMQVTLGGDRLGAGKRQKIELRNYERSTHDLGYLWRSTMAPGTLVPFMSEVALPGDTFDITLQCDVKTHPTIGPLFGSFKVQLDVFQAPLRLYHSALHNNTLGIGLKMNTVKLPNIRLHAQPWNNGDNTHDLDNSQINPSCLLSYLGIRGVGFVATGALLRDREFNAIPILAYWEIYKNYYANKQEEIGAVIHTPAAALVANITSVEALNPFYSNAIPDATTTTNGSYVGAQGDQITITFAGTVPPLEQIQFNTSVGPVIATNIYQPGYSHDTLNWTGTLTNALIGVAIYSWQYISAGSNPVLLSPAIATFPLSEIDDMRTAILAHQPLLQFNINDSASALRPYRWLYEPTNDIPNMLFTQEGLALKTYQSDLFNNWLQTEWIDGTGGINEITAIDTSTGSFTIDTLILSRKVYDMLNRIAVSGGSYDDWLDAVYTHERYTRCESPMYMGGLSKELVFQEVVSNSQATDQPLGTLAGKGIMSGKHKGGNVTIKVDEPSYIIGIISITPRIDYSQGNKWDTYTLQTMDDLHKPGLDEIGFQELITEQMAWWSTEYNTGTALWDQKSAGKQPAWINYMTNVNRTFGNFAIQTNEMFMTLNRRYEQNVATGDIKDLTTYVDPTKYNQIFAQTSIDAQNFWTQIAVDITARRKLSAKVMPNL